MKKIAIFLYFFVPVCLYAQNLGIIPTPTEIKIDSTRYLKKTSDLAFKMFEGSVYVTPQIKNVIKEFFDINKQFVRKNNRLDTSISSVDEDLIIVSLICECRASYHPESYYLTINENNIEIKASTFRGLYYGIQSLKQIFSYAEATHSAIPCCTIHDVPVLNIRGWMDDISRGPIPTVEFIKLEIKTLSEYKLNFFNLYSENVFKSNHYPDLAPMDGLTADEIKEIELYADLHFVEFSGNQQAFGHMEKVLKNPNYAHLGDDLSILNPGNPETIQFLDQYLTEISSLYKSPFFNINCDETEGLGNGNAKPYVDQVGKSQAYINHIITIHNILKKQQKKVLLWADIMVKDPEISKQLPKDLIPIFWAYHVAESFNSSLEQLAKGGYQFLVAPGTSSWGTILPDYNTYTQNIAVMVRDGARNNTLGMLNTSWDDSGESLFQSVWHAQAWGAEMAWNPCKEIQKDQFQVELQNRLEQFDRNYSIYRFGIEGFSTIYKQILHIQNSNTDKIGTFRTTWDRLTNFQPELTSSAFKQFNEQVILQSDLAKTELKEFQRKVRHNRTDLDFFVYGLDRLKLNANKNLFRKMIYDQLQSSNDSIRESIVAENKKLELELQQLKTNYLQLWDFECRPFFKDQNITKYEFFKKECRDILFYIQIIPTHINRIEFPQGTPTSKSETIIILKPLFKNENIYYNYTADGTVPTRNSNKYNFYIPISLRGTLTTLTYNEKDELLFQTATIEPHLGIGTITKLVSPYSTYKPEYSGGGVYALGDGFKGSSSFADGRWQGFQGNDIVVEYNFFSTKMIQSIETDFYQNCLGWILAPAQIELYISDNGADYKLFKTLDMQEIGEHDTGIFKGTWSQLNIETQYLKIVIKNKGKLPAWHSSPGSESYIFCDEIVIR